MKTRLLKISLILLGLIMILSYIWMRFIRMRLPKDIPFTFSILGFFIMIYICFIYAFIIYNLIKSLHAEEFSSSSPLKQITKEIVDNILLPAYTFDQFIKNLPRIKNYHKKFMVYLASKLKYHIIKTNNYYYFIVIIPRLILITTLFIDTFWFHQLYYIYKVLLVAILLVFNRYLIYSFKNIRETSLNELKSLTSGMIINQFIEKIYVEHYAQMYLEDKTTNPNFDESDWTWDLDEIPPTLYIKDIELFINYKMDNEEEIDYYLLTNRKIIGTARNSNFSFDLERSKKESDILKEKMEDILKLSYIIHNYEITNKNTAIIKIKIFSYYVICWLYILIISVHTLDILELINVINKTWILIENPFSCLPLER